MASFITKPLKRTIKVLGIDYPVIAVFTADGLSMSLSGFKLKIFCSWDSVVHNAMHTPDNVPSILEGQPYKFLKDQAAKLSVKLAKKAQSNLI